MTVGARAWRVSCTYRIKFNKKLQQCRIFIDEKPAQELADVYDNEKNSVICWPFCYNSNVVLRGYISGSGKYGGYYNERINFRSKDGF